jgi:hypothetical protein
MNNNPFKPDQPNIPGVLPRDEAKKAAGEQAAKAAPAPSKFSAPQMPPLWVILSATSVVAVCLIAVWWMRGTSAKEPSAASAEAAVAAAAAPAGAPETKPEKIAVGPGEIATTDELGKTWAAKKFIFRDPTTSKQVPSMVVHLPGGVYWGFSLIEPYGTCEMEFVTDMERLRKEYNYRGSHPMVADPCNHAVFDLSRYGNGPAGLVRGEIAQGAAVRPPMAIEIQVRGKQVLAKKME